MISLKKIRMQGAPKAKIDKTGESLVDYGPDARFGVCDYQYSFGVTGSAYPRVPEFPANLIADLNCRAYGGFNPTFGSALAYVPMVRCKRVTGKFFYEASGINVVAENSPQKCRMMVVRVNRPWDATSSIDARTEVLGGFDWNGAEYPASLAKVYTCMINSARQPLYEILYDRVMYLPPVGIAGNTAVDADSFPTLSLNNLLVNFDLELDFQVNYVNDAADLRFETVCGGLAFYCFAEGSLGNTLTPAWNLEGTVRVQWDRYPEDCD